MDQLDYHDDTRESSIDSEDQYYDEDEKKDERKWRKMWEQG